MMTKQPVQLISPRFAAALYFAFLAIIFLVLAKFILLSVANNLNLPLLPMLLSVILTGAIAGALFGEWLAKPQAWWRLMLLGCALALLGLFQITWGILVRAWLFENVFFQHLQRWQDYVVVFGLVFSSVTLIVGLWMIPLTGLAAIYFNKHFLPGLLAADAQRLHNTDTPDQESNNQND